MKQKINQIQKLNPNPKIKFINEDKIEFQDKYFKFLKYFFLFFIFIFILFFLIGSIKLIIKGNWEISQ